MRKRLSVLAPIFSHKELYLEMFCLKGQDDFTSLKMIDYELHVVASSMKCLNHQRAVSHNSLFNFVMYEVYYSKKENCLIAKEAM